MQNNMSDNALLEELGERLQRYRLNKNMTQATLAREAGISERTIIRIEQGESTQMSNFIRLLRSLGLLENMDALVPKAAISPIQQLKLQGNKRKRASSSTDDKASETWSWGGDE